MAKLLSITTEDEENIEEAVREVARLIEQGYTSGQEPIWSIEEIEE